MIAEGHEGPPADVLTGVASSTRPLRCPLLPNGLTRMDSPSTPGSGRIRSTTSTWTKTNHTSTGKWSGVHTGPVLHQAAGLVTVEMIQIDCEDFRVKLKTIFMEIDSNSFRQR